MDVAAATDDRLAADWSKQQQQQQRRRRRRQRHGTARHGTARHDAVRCGSDRYISCGVHLSLSLSWLPTSSCRATPHFSHHPLPLSSPDHLLLHRSTPTPLLLPAPTISHLHQFCAVYKHSVLLITTSKAPWELISS